MNQDSDNKLPGDESDPMVSAEYRTTATERTPPALDAVVLKKAKAAAEDSGLRGFTAFWFRPLAFVATLGLSLALLLELTGPLDLQSVKSPEPEIGRREAESTVADPIPAVIGITSGVRRSADSPAGKNQSAEPLAPTQAVDPSYETGRQQRLETTPSTANDIEAAQVPASVNAPVTDEHTSADFADMIEASSEQMQEQDRVTENAIQGLKQIRADDKVQVEEVAAFRASAYLSNEAARPCTDEQMAVPVTWWQCISDLDETGRHDEAKAEMDRFNKAHPDFKAPEILPSQ